jgi:F-type H+-transporting ATPase subunit b
MRFLLLTAFVVALPAIASASGTAEHAQGGPTPAQWKLLAFTAANFAIFIYLMFRLARTPLRDFLSGRRRDVVAGMEEAARLKEEAERLKREYEAKSAALDQTRADLIAEVRAVAQASRERALAEAREAAERLRRDSDRTAQSDLERAREELRAEAARLAQGLAADELRSRLTEQDRQRLLSEFLTRVEK